MTAAGSRGFPCHAVAVESLEQNAVARHHAEDRHDQRAGSRSARMGQATGHAVIMEPGSPSECHPGVLDQACNWLSFTLLAIAFLWACTLMCAFMYSPGHGWAFTKIILLAPWIPQFPRPSFWRKVRRYRPPACDIALAVFFAFSLLSCLASRDQQVSFFFTLQLMLCLGNTYALARIILDAPRKVVALLALGLLALIAIYAVAFLETRFDRNYFFCVAKQLFAMPVIKTILAGYGHYRIAMLFMNPLPAAQAMLLVSATLSVLCIVPGRRPRIAGIVAAALSSVCSLVVIFLTGSRATMLALLVSGGLLFALRTRPARKTLVAVVVACGLLITGIHALNPKPLVRNGNGFKLRMEHFFLGAHILRQHPLLGIGPRAGAYANSAKGIYPAYLASYTPVLHRTPQQAKDYYANVRALRTLENTFLTITVEHGIFAGLAMLTFALLLLLQAREDKAREVQPGLRPVHTALTFILTAFLISANGHDTHVWMNLNAVFGILAGMFVNLPLILPRLTIATGGCSQTSGKNTGSGDR